MILCNNSTKYGSGTERKYPVL